MAKKSGPDMKAAWDKIMSGVEVKNSDTADTYLKRLNAHLAKHPDIAMAVYNGSGHWTKGEKKLKRRKIRDHDFTIVTKDKGVAMDYAATDVIKPNGKELVKLRPVVATVGHLRWEEKSGALGNFAGLVISPKEILKGQKLMDAHARRTFRGAVPTLVKYGMIPMKFRVKEGEREKFFSKVALDYFGALGIKPGLEFDLWHANRSVKRGWKKSRKAVKEVKATNTPLFFKALREVGFTEKKVEGGHEYTAPSNLKRARMPRTQAQLIGRPLMFWRRSIKGPILTAVIGGELNPKKIGGKPKKEGRRRRPK